MGRLLLCLLLTSGLSLGVLQGGVDYFRNSNEKTEKKEQEKEDKRKYYEELYKAAQEWFPETTNPLEKAFYKNPDDPVLVELLNRFYTERQERANLLASRLVALQTQEEEKIAQVLRNYTVLYFYSPNCPYCRASEPYLGFLQSNAKQFLRINTTLPENSAYLRDFNVKVVPTLVFMKDNKVVQRWEGLWIYPSEKTKTFLRSLP